MNDTCDWCGRPIDQPIIYEGGDNISIICGNCFQLKTTCRSCMKAKECLFETDLSPLPRTVQQRVQQGGATMIREIQNPARVEITCKKGCSCFSEEFGCMRQSLGFCKDYEPLKKGND